MRQCNGEQLTLYWVKNGVCIRTCKEMKVANGKGSTNVNKLPVNR